MVEQIEDPLFSQPCEIIKNRYPYKCTFHDVEDNSRAHDTSTITAQTKKAIKKLGKQTPLG